MKKVAIVGALWAPNFGDVLLAKLFGEAFLRHGAQVMLPNAAESVRREVGFASTLSDIRRADIVVFCGGGYFSEPPNGGNRWAISRYKLLYWYATYCRLVGKPYYVLGVGAGPIISALSKAFIRHVCNGAEIVAVRDYQSLTALKLAGFHAPVELVADYVLAMRPSALPEASLPPTKIGLHVTMNGRRIIPAMIEYFSGKNKELDVFFVEDHLGEYDRVAAQYPLIGEICNGGVIRYSNVSSFIGAIDGLDFVITCKLHVGILSAVLGKRICAFPYHPKVERFYEELGRLDVLADATELEDIKKHVSYCFQSDPVLVPEKIINRARELNKIIKNICDDKV